ncbi:UNVERIFIED_ORG: hypothetical protein ABIB52_004461 [Arthrobacter sp. UYCu721]
MCLGSLYYCSPEKVVFLTQRDDYEPHYVDDRKYFELATFYAEFVKDWTERRLPMEYQPRDAAIDVDREWQHCNSGNRHVLTPDTGNSSSAGDERESPAPPSTVNT